MFIWVLTLLCGLLSLLHLNEATISVDFDEDFRNCENGKPMPGLDTTNFQVLPESDGSITLNGTFRFTRDYENPTRWKFYTKRLERGNWIQGIVSRDIPNLCPVLQMPYELWYPYTRLLQRKYCPYRAGHEEHVNNVNIGNLATTFQVPQEFIGEWRVYHSITTTRKGRPVDECVMIPVTISEATMSLEFDEDVRDCENGMPMPGFDTSEFQVLPQDDGSVMMNGTIKFTKDYESPTKMKMYTKRLEQGEWKPGMVAREIQNLCPVLQVPTELWYPYTRILQQKTCPFRAGHEEHMNNVNVENAAAKFHVPPDFLGEWRVYHEFTTTRAGSSFEECLMVPVTVSEV